MAPPPRAQRGSAPASLRKEHSSMGSSFSCARLVVVIAVVTALAARTLLPQGEGVPSSPISKLLYLSSCGSKQSQKGVASASYSRTAHRHFTLDNVWNTTSLARLREMVRKRGTYRTSVDDSTSAVEHAGEAEPVHRDANGDVACANPLMVPNRNKTLCVFPSRLDVGKHFMTTGGISGRKELYESLVARLLGFFGFVFDNFDSPELQALFRSPAYVDAANQVCEGRTVFDPIQLGIILLVPGQEVPMHWDVPWFTHATRFSLPQWLLVAMERSGLWSDERIPQIQGVAYLHNWTDTDARGGGFYYFPDGSCGPERVVPAKPNTALVLDGSVVVHGVEPYLGERPAPPVSKQPPSELVYKGNDTWALRVRGKEIASYSHDDLRISLVWRARCFASEEERDKWHATERTLTVDEAVSRLLADLRRRGRLPENHTPTGSELATTLLREYADYPIHVTRSWMPFNPCALERLHNGWWTAPLRWLCRQ